MKTYDVAVIGAGVFGAWTALQLARRGKRVILLEAYGPGHSRSSSGDESRIIRMGYGKDEIYTRWSQRSLAQWKELFARIVCRCFMRQAFCGLPVPMMRGSRKTRTTLRKCGVPFEELDSTGLRACFPQIGLDGIHDGVLEPHSGVIVARRAVAATVAEAIRLGVTYAHALVESPKNKGTLQSVKTNNGEEIFAGHFVFACGAWLGKLFPEILKQRILSRGKKFFILDCHPEIHVSRPPALPTFLFQNDESYGMPDIENRGLKIALDAHGAAVDPDTQSRVVSEKSAQQMREYVARRFPALGMRPSRKRESVNTKYLERRFLIDRHPKWKICG